MDWEAARTANLIERAKRDPDAFGDLYRLHYVDIAGYILRRVGDPHLAEDLAADTFIDAWRAIPRYRNQGIDFQHWLLRIATNRVNRWARRKRREHPVARVPELTCDDIEHSREVTELLLTLRADHQTVLCLHHVEGLGVECIARILDVSPGTVKSRLHRARTAMRTILDSQKEAES